MFRHYLIPVSGKSLGQLAGTAGAGLSITISVLAEPKPPMFSEEQAQAVRTLLEQHVMGGGVWATDDCHKTYEALKAKGIEFLPPTQEFYGIEALFRDGCGNWFSLTQHTPEVVGK
ncbi:MAG: hypothetical protein U0401_13675 [Anaerolineae bacterium]